MSDRRAGLLLFGLLWSAFAFFTHKDMGAPATSRLNVLHAMVKEQRFVIDSYEKNTKDKAYFDDHVISDKAPGTSLLGIPAFLESNAILRIRGIDLDSSSGWAISNWITTIGSVALLAALGGLALWHLLLRWVRRRTALVAVLGMMLGTLVFPYAGLFFSHGAVIGLLSMALLAAQEPIGRSKGGRDEPALPPHTMMTYAAAGGAVFWAIVLFVKTWSSSFPAPSVLFLLVFGIYVALIGGLALVIRNTDNPHWLEYWGLSYRDMFVGLACSLALISEFTSGLAAVGICVFVLVRKPSSALSLFIGCLPSFVLFSIYNVETFGALLSIGYQYNRFTWMHRGFFGLIFPPSIGSVGEMLLGVQRGLFFYSPFLLLALVGYFSFPAGRRNILILSATVPALHVLAIACMVHPLGGMAFGPRYLAPMVPFLAIPTALGLQKFPRVGSALIALSVLLTTIAVSVNPQVTKARSFPLLQDYLPRLLKGSFEPTAGAFFAANNATALTAFLCVLVLASLLLWKRLDSRS